MVAVIVRHESKIEPDMMLALPDAINTIIVSPIARPNPSTHAANTPGSAAGRTICQATCQRAAPSGTENNNATSVAFKLPRNSGTTLYLGISLTGCQMYDGLSYPCHCCGWNIIAQLVVFSRISGLALWASSSPFNSTNAFTVS